MVRLIPKDENFSPQRMLDQIDAMQNDSRRLVPKLDFINRLIIRFYAVYLMRDQLMILGQRLSFIDNSTWGPGRVDTFNAPKALLNFPMKHASPSELMGNADFPSVWYQQARKGMHLHWDGNNTSVDERNLSAAFGTGAYPPVLDRDRVRRRAGGGGRRRGCRGDVAAGAVVAGGATPDDPPAGDAEDRYEHEIGRAHV